MQVNFPLRAVSKCGNFLVPFILADGPCPVDKDHFVLTERPNSPILRYDSILRGFDIEGLFEGDIIRIDEDGKKNEYAVLYSSGLKICIPESNVEKFYENDGKYDIVSDIYNRGLKFIKRSEPKFKLKDTYFLLREIYGMHDGMLLLNNELLRAHPDEVKQHAGLRNIKGKYLYFGDAGLTLKNGRLGIYEGDNFLDLISGEIQNVEELELWKKLD